VTSVGAINYLPLEGNAGRGFQIEGRAPADPANGPGANYAVACPNYFHSMGIPILKGREFNHQDTLESPGVIVINEAMAHEFWPKEDPVGKAILFGGSEGPRLTVVGVAGDVHFRGLDAPVTSQFMRPYTQAAWPTMSIVVNTRFAPATLTTQITKAIKAFLPDRPVSEVETMEDIVANSTGSRRLPMVLLSVFSAVALLLAAVGITGVVSYSVTQRMPELGIRIALGARGMDVLGLVLRGSMKWVGAGLTLGIAGSFVITRLLGALLYGVRPTDPMVLGTVSLLLGTVALLASYFPARRAGRLDPIRTLRHQ
jgi:putative ABC transport system permease protein